MRRTTIASCHRASENSPASRAYGSSPRRQLNCGAWGYRDVPRHAIAIHKDSRKRDVSPTIDQLRKTVGELAISNERLANTQEAPAFGKAREHGTTAAGIAHEVNNPLGVVLMYSHPSDEHGDDQVLRGLEPHRRRRIAARRLWRGFLIRTSEQVQLEIRYQEHHRKPSHPARPENIESEINYTGDTVAENGSRPGHPGHDQPFYQRLRRHARRRQDDIETGGMRHRSTPLSGPGAGIPKENLNKIRTLLFHETDRKEQGLGLAVTYGIIKMHYGDIKVTTTIPPDRREPFTVTLPRQGRIEL